MYEHSDTCCDTLEMSNFCNNNPQSFVYDSRVTISTKNNISTGFVQVFFSCTKCVTRPSILFEEKFIR